MLKFQSVQINENEVLIFADGVRLATNRENARKLLLMLGSELSKDMDDE